MKAVTQRKYGSADVLTINELEKPVAGDNEVLVQIHAASINNADLDFLHGNCLIRPGGLFRPKYKIPGSDIAGKVESTGKLVTQFKVGDEVLGDLSECGFSAFSEYVAVPEEAISLKPQGITFVDAASIPQAGSLAYQSLVDHRLVKPGDKVLINGAGGGTGSFAIQMAKVFGAEVTAVDKANKLDMARSIGADHVIDYTKEDFTKLQTSYDLIIDMVASRSPGDIRKVLSPEGTYVLIGGSIKVIFQVLLYDQIASKSRKQKLSILYGKPNKYIDIVTELVASGKVKPVIDKCYPLDAAPDAFRQFENGQFQGKIVITMG